MARKVQARKTSAKSTAKSRPGKKPVSAPERDSLAKLRSHVDALEKRLKRADQLTRKSVKALKASYESLYELQAGQTPSAEMHTQMQKLSHYLTGMIEQTRRDMAHDLKIVLEDPRIETVALALAKANKRLQKAEQNQAEAINRINAHIARLAAAVDKRIETETHAREVADTKLESRIEQVELASAEAIQSLGDKVIKVADELQDRVKHLKGELAEEAVIRQQNYEEHKFEMARRIEAIEDDQRNTIPAFERQLDRLASRVELLEQTSSTSAGVTLSGDAGDVLANSIPAPIPDSPPSAGVESYEAYSPDERQAVSPPSFQSEVKDAFAPQTRQEAVSMPPPYQTAPMQDAAQHMPQPFVAENAAQAYAPVEYVAPMQPEGSGSFQPRSWVPGGDSGGQSVVSEAAQQYANSPQNPTAITDNVYNLNPPPPPMPEVALEAGDGLPPIERLEPTMESVRPGAAPEGKPKKKKAGKKSRLKTTSEGRTSTLKRTLMMAAAAVVLVFAAKTFVPKFFGGDTRAPLTAPANDAENKAPVEVVASGEKSPDTHALNQGQSEPSIPVMSRKVETVAPQGDYSKGMTAPDLGRGVVAQSHEKTLEAAAKAGDPIAQFQLGLSNLEAGHDKEAVRLIRLSAAQGQPAAQYRLAKIYEAGLGVDVNTKTSKSLLLKAAKAGNRLAMHDLGHYYATGADGEAPDLVKAATWFTRAAEHGVVDSQFNLGVLYQGGSGVPQDLEESWFWFKVAAAQGDKIAAQRAKAVALDLSPEQLALAKGRFKAFSPKPINNAANGIFKDLPWMNSASVTAPVRGSSVKTAQTLLQKLGYNVGQPDGAMGPNTRNAIINFERANGLPQTGRVNADLIARLKLAAGV